MDKRFSRYMEGQLLDAARDLEMPDSYYEKAATSYESFAQYLSRPDSSLSSYTPDIFLQGSIKTGTAIKPVTDGGSYDVDVVCRLAQLSKAEITQKDLKTLIGREVIGYSAKHAMAQDPHDGHRCWTLDYVDEANFHIDILPTIGCAEDGQIEEAAAGHRYSAEAGSLAYTDKRHCSYAAICDDWPTTNPKGYASWFFKASSYENYRNVYATRFQASIEGIRPYQVRSPLQRYVQLLKRHRDILFDGRLKGSPSPRSIIITTLAARAYEELDQEGWYEDFVGVVQNMPAYIERYCGGYRLENPSNSRENFLDQWTDDDYEAFLAWHKRVVEDIAWTGKVHNRLFPKRASETIRSSFGLQQKRTGALVESSSNAPSELSYHQPLEWTEIEAIPVTIIAEKCRSGGVYKPFRSGDPLPKNADLRFIAKADDAKGFTVHWQVTNSGREALQANCLRGGFYPEVAATGKRYRPESTKYIGEHYVECYLEKDGVVYGRSEPFIVNITDDAVSRSREMW